MSHLLDMNMPIMKHVEFEVCLYVCHSNVSQLPMSDSLDMG